jgi:hypothetical protein
VKVFKRQKDFGGVELGLAKRKLLALNVQHEVASTDVLHHKIDTGLCLETGVQSEKERVSLACSCEEDTLFRACTIHDVMSEALVLWRAQLHLPFNLVIINNEFFFQNFDRVKTIRFLLFRQHNLPKVAFTQYCQEIKVIQANLPFTYGLWGRALLRLT